MAAGNTALDSFAVALRELAEGLTDGAVQVRVFSSGTLGQEREAVQQRAATSTSPRPAAPDPRLSRMSGEAGAKLRTMVDTKATSAPSPREPEIDENGVDLAQIRAMLDLGPAERLARVSQFTNALLEIQALNGNRQSG